MCSVVYFYRYGITNKHMFIAILIDVGIIVLYDTCGSNWQRPAKHNGDMSVRFRPCVLRYYQMITGITCGAFDYKIHKGHILFLNQCRLLCDKIIVLVVPDSVIVKNKNRRPFYKQEIRRRNVFDTGLVDSSVSLHGTTVEEIINRVHQIPNGLYILGKDQNTNKFNHLLTRAFYNLGIPVVSTIEDRIESTTNLLIKKGYL